MTALSQNQRTVSKTKTWSLGNDKTINTGYVSTNELDTHADMLGYLGSIKLPLVADHQDADNA
eukprot:13016340-Ditylum_brightwellii.AAC.1